MRKTLKVLLIILAFVIVSGLGYGGYYFCSLAKNSESARDDLRSKNESLQKELSDAKNALQNVEEKSLTEPTPGKSTCPSILASDEQSVVSNWKTYKNSSRNYSFKYPASWAISGQGDEVLLSYAPAKISMSFRGGSKASVDLSSMNKEKTEQTIVDCQSATEVFYSSENSKTITTAFKKGGTSYMVMITYEDQGASVSNNLIASYNLILKTIAYN